MHTYYCNAFIEWIDMALTIQYKQVYPRYYRLCTKTTSREVSPNFEAVAALGWRSVRCASSNSLLIDNIAPSIDCVFLLG